MEGEGEERLSRGVTDLTLHSTNNGSDEAISSTGSTGRQAAAEPQSGISRAFQLKQQRRASSHGDNGMLNFVKTF